MIILTLIQKAILDKRKNKIMKKIALTILLASFIGVTLAQNSTMSTTSVATNSTHKKTKTTSKKTTKTHHKKNKAKIRATKSKRKHHRSNTQKSVVANNYAASQSIPNDYVNTGAIKRQPRLYSYSAIALDAKTGEIFISKNPNTKLPIASITKLMTAMVFLDSGVNLDDYVTITDSDIDTLRNTYSRLKVGMQFRRRDLLLLALMSSENRAAHALARTTYKGGLPVFIHKMNEKAKSLKMTNTQFYDPTGLTNQNQSTVTDLSKMVQAAYTYDDIRKDTTTKDASVMFGPKYIHRYINSDVLVRGGDKIQIELSKTGFINEAGHCLALYSIIDNKPVVMVFLNSTGKSGRILDAMTVKNYVLKMKG